MDSRELRAERKRLIDEQRRILEAMTPEQRGVMTSEQQTKYGALEKDVDALAQHIARVEKVESAERSYVPETQRETAAVPASEDKAAQYRDAFWRSMRAGVGPAELRVMAMGTDTQGGYTVPDEFRRELIKGLDEANVVRGLATVIQTNTGTLTIPTLTAHGSAAWTAENGPYTETTPEFSEITLTPNKASVLLKVSEELLNDSAFAIEPFVAAEFARALAELEETAFVSGDGSGKPTGLIAASGGTSAGVTAAATNAITADELVGMVHSIARPYRRNAVWLMNDATILAIRKLVTGVSGDKTYLWQPGLQASEPDLLLGRPVYSCADMQTIAASKKVALFGDLKYYYIAEKPGISMQRLSELYAANGHVGFRIFRRLDAKLALSDAVKHLIMHS